MRKTFVVLAVLVFALLALFAWTQGEGDPAKPETPISGTPAPVTAGIPADSTREDAEPGRVEVVVPPTATATDGHVLVDAVGVPQPGVLYWVDERPYRMHPGTAPANAPRTDVQGRFDPRAETLGPGEFLWFQVDDGLSLAIPRGSLSSFSTVRIPKRKEVTVEIRSLPADESWLISVYPAWIDDDMDWNHGANHVQEAPTAAESGAAWIARRRMEKRGTSGPARARFLLLDGMPAAFYCQALGYEIEPEIQEIANPDNVIAHASGHRSVFPLQVVEGDGVTRSSLGGRAFFSSESGGWSYGHDFEGGRTKIAWSDADDTLGVWLSVVLADGEVFRTHVEDKRIADHRTLELVRGSGRAAAMRLRLTGSVGHCPKPKVYVGARGELAAAEPFHWFSPFDIDEPLGVGAWVHDDHLVIQTRDPSTKIETVSMVASDGRMAHAVGTSLVSIPEVAMQPIEPRALIERLAEPAGSGYLMVAHEIALPGALGVTSEWVRVCTWRFHQVAGFGWRFSPTSSIDVHETLPEAIQTSAPEGVRSRLRARVRSRPDWIDLPHEPIR